uniref:Helitron helicase-like domain-containing protein n=1 Tax=Globodera rostochiensis TaxID=31243 RepID=A0A914H6D2_GLORO
MTDEHFRGSRQFYQREYANCMTICREFGPPDLLVTFTMSPDCPELQAMLGTDAGGKQQQWFDRPDLVCRLFVDKLQELYKDLTERGVLGPVRAWFGALEHQFRGLPHVHTAIILDWDRMRNMGKIQTPADYIDEYICAEIPPNPTGRTKEAAQQRALHKTITTKNIHTCSTKHCLQDGKCRKHFPKPFEYDNVHSENAYPRYKRRPPPPSIQEAQQNPELYGREIQYKDQRGKTIRKDNSHVVAFSPFLSSKYVAHINVEFVAGDGCIKYLCKYMMKGADMAFVQVTDGNTGQSALNYDEMHQIRLARYISSMEAYLQQLGTPLIRRSHQVDELDVHGPQGHRIAVQQGFEDEEEQRNAFCEAAQAEEERRNAGEERVTQLTAYFAFNEQSWDFKAIRQLLLHVQDPTSWIHLRTVDTTIFPTFVDAARARNLMSDMTIWLNTIKEAFNTKKSIKQRLRWLAVFLATANLTNGAALLEEIMKDANKWLVSTKVGKAPPEQQLQYVLRALEWFLLANGIRPDTECREDGTYETACEHIGLPRPEGVHMTADQLIQLTFFRNNVIIDNIDPELLPDQLDCRQRVEDYYRIKYFEDPQPNTEQQQLIEDVYKGCVDAQQVISGQQTSFTPGVSRLFMVTGEGGAGKTFSYNFAVWDFNPPSSSLPALHGQLFTIPPADAQTRLSEISTDHNLSPELMEFLFDVLRRYHPYAALYQTAAEMFRQLPQQEQVNLRMLFVDSTPHGEERVFSDDVVRPAPIIAPAVGVHQERLVKQRQPKSFLFLQLEKEEPRFPKMGKKGIERGEQVGDLCGDRGRKENGESENKEF